MRARNLLATGIQIRLTRIIVGIIGGLSWVQFVNVPVLERLSTVFAFTGQPPTPQECPSDPIRYRLLFIFRGRLYSMQLIWRYADTQCANLCLALRQRWPASLLSFLGS